MTLGIDLPSLKNRTIDEAPEDVDWRLDLFDEALERPMII